MLQRFHARWGVVIQVVSLWLVCFTAPLPSGCVSAPDVKDPAFEAPVALRAHLAPPPLVFDFTGPSGLSPWLTWMPAKASDGVELTLPGRTDQNHVSGVGPIYLLMHLRMSWLLQSGKPCCDLRWAELVVSVRTSGLDLAGGRICWWIVSDVDERPESTLPWQQTNWAYLGRPALISCDSGEQFQTVSTVLDPDPSLWMYAGTNRLSPWADRYVWSPLASALQDVDATLHMVIVGCDPGRMPSGQITIRSVEVRFASPPPCPSDEEIERVLASGDWAAARPLLEVAAAFGKAGAAFHLGNALKFGLGGPVDFRRALGYFEMAAPEVPEAAIEQADMLALGIGTARDYPAALRLLTSDRVVRLPRGKYLLGMMLWRGLGTSVDLERARNLLEAAADDGYPLAIAASGFLSIELKDYEQAYRWLQLAIECFAVELATDWLTDETVFLLQDRIPGTRQVALDEEVAAWPSRPFSAAKHPD